ncbi:hypothetical protein B0H14DRAFT_3617101 [Mycena olivaceomarginata]|nr:hypothetical protein B0H14DRAFT_3617101 [Mycena olivaceomarginata]
MSRGVLGVWVEPSAVVEKSEFIVNSLVPREAIHRGFDMDHGESKGSGVLRAEPGGTRLIERPIGGIDRPPKRNRSDSEILGWTNKQITFRLLIVIRVGETSEDRMSEGTNQWSKHKYRIQELVMSFGGGLVFPGSGRDPQSSPVVGRIQTRKLGRSYNNLSGTTKTEEQKQPTTFSCIGEAERQQPEADGWINQFRGARSLSKRNQCTHTIGIDVRGFQDLLQFFVQFYRLTYQGSAHLIGEIQHLLPHLGDQQLQLYVITELLGLPNYPVHDPEALISKGWNIVNILMI